MHAMTHIEEQGGEVLRRSYQRNAIARPASATPNQQARERQAVIFANQAPSSAFREAALLCTVK